MAKVSSEAKKRYFDKVKIYKKNLEQIQAREKNILRVIEQDENGAEFKKFSLADENLNLAAIYILLNELSVSLLGVKNEAFLNDARKACYKSIIYLEEIVSDYIDVPFSDYKERLEKIETIKDQERYALVKKIGFTIQSVEESFGENSKWKWSFVDLEGRFTTVAKNLIDMKNLVAGLDPRAEGYMQRLDNLKLIKELLQKAADRFRQKYELSTNRIDDFKKAILYLEALKRLTTLLGEANVAESVSKKIDVWKTKMEADDKKSQKKGLTK